MQRAHTEHRANRTRLIRNPEILDAYRFLAEALEQKLFVPNRVEVIPGGLEGINEGFRRQRAHEASRHSNLP